MIFVDSNVPMYLVGAPHRHRTEAAEAIARCLAAEERLVSDAEVLQEILHRYVSIDRRDAIQPAFDALLGLVDEVLPILPEDVQRARDVVLDRRQLSARDAIHVAVMGRAGIEHILSYDTGFDAVPGITRIR